MPLGIPIPVRLSDADMKALKSLTAKTKVNRAALLRVAIMLGLPLVEKNFSPQSKPAKKKGVAK